MTGVAGKITMAARALSQHGLSGLISRSRWWLRERAANRETSQWLLSHGHALSTNERQLLNERIGRFSHAPLISILMPVYDVDERWLRLAIGSVLRQVYPTWELCIADDCSPSPHVRRVLEESAAQDDRIKIIYRETNGHISQASNSALGIATGEFTGLLDHDDELTEDALFHVVAAINDDPSLEMIYSDEDGVNEQGGRYAPKLKPDWSRDLFYSVNYVTHFAVYRTAVLKKIGGFRVGFEGSQDYDLALRVIEEIDEAAIVHIPHILYHWRAIRGSVALSAGEKPYAHERGRQAIREHFVRSSVQADVVESSFDLHRVIYRMPAPRRSVSFIVTGSDGDFASGAADLGEVVIVGPDVGNKAASLNAAVSRSGGDVLIFIDGELTTERQEWLDELVAAAMQPSIGAAAGRIIGTGGMVEQSGIVLNSDLSPAFAHHGFPREAPGNLFRNRQIGNVSAISSACMVITRENFETVGGFDQEAFPNDLFDIDLCLKLRGLKKRIVVLPHVEFVRRGEAKENRQCAEEELSTFEKKWAEYGERDPFCNANLKRDGSFEIDC
jgi:GT2 family glycosyltransferase